MYFTDMSKEDQEALNAIWAEMDEVNSRVDSADGEIKVLVGCIDELLKLNKKSREIISKYACEVDEEES